MDQLSNSNRLSMKMITIPPKNISKSAHHTHQTFINAYDYLINECLFVVAEAIPEVLVEHLHMYELFLS